MKLASQDSEHQDRRQALLGVDEVNREKGKSQEVVLRESVQFRVRLRREGQAPRSGTFIKAELL